jgi:hypothetical protein
VAKSDRPPKRESERARAVRRLNEVVMERRRLRVDQATARSDSGGPDAGAPSGANDRQPARDRFDGKGA